MSDEEPTLRRFKQNIVRNFAEVVHGVDGTLSHRCGAFKIERDPWGIHLSRGAATLLVELLTQQSGKT